MSKNAAIIIAIFMILSVFEVFLHDSFIAFCFENDHISICLVELNKKLSICFFKSRFQSESLFFHILGILGIFSIDSFFFKIRIDVVDFFVIIFFCPLLLERLPKADHLSFFCDRNAPKRRKWYSYSHGNSFHVFAFTACLKYTFAGSNR